MKKFLKEIMHIDMMINCKLEQVEELRDRLTSIGGATDGERVQTSVSADRLTDTIAKIIELENEINRDIDRLVDCKQRAMNLIEQLNDTVEKTILYKRYFQSKSFEQIAVECGYSWRHIHRIHSNALQHLNHVIECHI